MVSETVDFNSFSSDHIIFHFMVKDVRVGVDVDLIFSISQPLMSIRTSGKNRDF